MQKILLIIIVLIVSIVIGYIAVKTTRQLPQQIFDQQTENLTEEQDDYVTDNNSDNEEFSNMANVYKKNWAGHEFEVAYLDTSQYPITGNKDIKFTDSGWYAPSYSLPRSKLLDVNLNQKIKVKITADIEGVLKSSNAGCTGDCILTERYHFTEFGIYLVDEDGDRIGLRVLGARINIRQEITSDRFKFTQLIVENNGEEIIVTDSSGVKISYSKDFKYVTSEGNREKFERPYYGDFSLDQKWMLGINCHVYGEGYCSLNIKDIQVIK